MNDIVLSLDPSSTAIGWAAMPSAANLLDGGVITPDVDDGSFDRIGNLCDSLLIVLEQVRPDTILIEWTIGKVGQRRHKGRGAGLSVYGAGVGYAAAVCRRWARDAGGCDLIAITENEWTRGVKKEDRQIVIARTFRNYPMDMDPKGDLSDAIGLAVWWFRQRNLFTR